MKCHHTNCTHAARFRTPRTGRYPHVCPQCGVTYESNRRANRSWPCAACSAPNRERIQVLLPTGPAYGRIIGETGSRQTLAIRMDDGSLVRAKRYGDGKFFATSDEGRKYLVEHLAS